MSRGRQKSKFEVDDQFEAFLKESVSSEDSTLDTGRVNKFLQPKKPKKSEQPWWMSGEKEESLGTGLSGTGKSFLKKKVQQTDNNRSQDLIRESLDTTGGASASRDSLDEESFGERRNPPNKVHTGLGIPALSLDSTQSYTETADPVENARPSGTDTLEEMADKEKFFKELERNSDKTIDYSRLNKDLDNGTMATMQTGQQRSRPPKQGNLDLLEDVESEDYSDEFETSRRDDVETTRENTSANTTKGDDPKANLLSKVALLDSLDSTQGTRHASREARDDEMRPIPETTENPDDDDDDDDDESYEEDDVDGKSALKTNTGYGLTATSNEDLEALQRALRDAGMSTMGSTMGDALLSGTGKPATDSSHHGGTSTGTFGLKHLKQDSEKSGRTVDDILREVQEIENKQREENRGFHLQPASQPSHDQHESQQQHDLSPLDKYMNGGPFKTTTTEPQGLDLSPVHTQQPHVRGIDLSPAHNQPDFQGFDLSPIQRQSIEQEPQLDDDTSPHRPVPSPRLSLHKKRSKVASPSRSREMFGHVRSSGYGQKSPSHKTTSKTRTKWSPANIAQLKIKGTDLASQKKSEVKVSSVTDQQMAPLADQQLLTSVESFAKYIQDQFGGKSSTPINQTKTQTRLSKDEPVLAPDDKLAAIDREKAMVSEVKEWQDQWKQERKMHAKVMAEKAAQEREFLRKIETMKLDYEDKLFKLKQDNFVLTAKVTEDSSSRTAARKPSDDAGSDSEQIQRLEKEVQEQEKLLAGYQQENQRLYDDMKKRQGTSKATQERMFTENQKLTAEVAKLKDDLQRKEVQLKNKGVITGVAAQQQIAASGGETTTAVLGAGRIAQLEVELRNAKAKEEELSREVEILRKTNKELEQHIEVMVHKLEEFETKVSQAHSVQSQESKDLIKTHQDEMDKMNRRLKWYAENQELLDRDSKQLREKDEEIKRLQLITDSLQSETGKSQAEAKTRLKERTLEAKKIQDLQRQVKEMEGIIKKRHPNSLPVLMWAAANAVSTSGGVKPPSTAFLEERIKKLEREADDKDEEAKRSLRVLEQKYNSMKFQYEERIEGLELKLSKYDRAGDGELKEGERPHSHTVALQRELDAVKDRHRKRLSELEAEIQQYKKEVDTLKAKQTVATKSQDKLSKETTSDSQLRLRMLEKELSTQQQDKLVLQRSVERLQREKQQLLADLTRQAERSNKDKPAKSRPRSAGKTRTKLKTPEAEEDDRDLPPYSNQVSRDREYQPNTFTGSHISEVLGENEALKMTIDRLQLDLDQQRVHLHKSLAESEMRERRAREETAEQVAALRSSHQMELQRILAEHAMNHSASKVAELTGKLDTQQVLVNHLKQQLTASQVDAEKYSAMKIREAALDTQVKSMLEDLREAKRSHTPEMRHFESLQDKIKELETRHRHREQELQQILRQSRRLHEAETAQQVEKWKKLVEVKNKETEQFRAELDSILQVLHELQRQGVVLPRSHKYPTPS